MGLLDKLFGSKVDYPPLPVRTRDQQAASPARLAELEREAAEADARYEADRAAWLAF